MPRTHHPHRGSKAFHPRSRAARIYPSLNKPQIKELKVAEFAGYKVGMTQVLMINDKRGAPTYNQEIAVPCTILETPPLKVFGIRAYAKAPHGYGIAPAIDVLASTSTLEKDLSRTFPLPKKQKTKIQDIEKRIGDITDIRLLVHTMPKAAGIGKRRPEVFEVAVGGATVAEKLVLAKERLGKEIAVKDVFKDGQLVDVAAVTRGFGFQGSIRRWHIKLLHHKAQKLHRKVGNLGPWHPHKVRWTVPQMGQMGYHTRLEHNHRILKVGEDPQELKNAAGWKRYGLIKNNFVLIKGSVPGHVKRLVMIRQAIRPYEAEKPPQIERIALNQW